MTKIFKRNSRPNVVNTEFTDRNIKVTTYDDGSQDLGGNCMIREFTGDRAFIGRCYFFAHHGICPRHGDVSVYLEQQNDGIEPDWPRDFDHYHIFPDGYERS